ncbi:MAG: DUF2164 family protein [Pseudomonadales bacterium]|nr:DUF2164 family protein [Pseudomonadales bacterium]
MTTLSDKKRQAKIRDIVSYFLDERDEKIGMIAAEGVLDFMLDLLGSDLYNTGVEDALRVVKQQHESLIVDLELLKV